MASNNSLDHIPDLPTFRSMLRFAAAVVDNDKSIEIFFILIIGARRGLRVGEIIHFCGEWYDDTRNVIVIPDFEDCDCALCTKYAKDKADNGGEPRRWETILAEDYWAPKSSAGARTIPLKTEREIEIVEEYIDRYGDVDVSYSTIYRRVKRLAELHPDLEPEYWSPHSLRATAATHLAWADFRQPALEGLFGWGSREYGIAYVRRTGIWVSREFDRILGLEDDPLELRADPPTRQQLRNDADELIEVDRWTPENDDDTPKHPRHRDAEEAFLDVDTENATLADFRMMFDPVSAALAHHRRSEHSIQLPTSTEAFGGAVAFALATVAMALMASWDGGSTAAMVVGSMLGFVKACS